MRKIALIVVVLLLAIAVVPAFAHHIEEPETVASGPLHCALQSPFGEAHGARNPGGQGAGHEAGGQEVDPSADQAGGVGVQTGDGASNENGKVCTPTRE